MEEAPVLTTTNAKRAAYELWTKLRSAHGKMRAAREKTEQTIDSVKQLVEVGGVAFGAAYANARWGQDGVIQVMGMPADLAVGCLGVAVSLLGVAGKYDEDILSASIGLLANPAVREGQKLGSQAMTTGGMPGRMYAGAVPAGMYSGAVPANQYAGAVPAGQYAGAVPAGAYAGSAPAGQKAA